jgi:N-carbamoylputrescine amidase
LAACNRIGTEDGNHFWGNSFVCGPQGEMLARAGQEATTVTVDLDRDRPEQIRRLWPFLRDRRIEAYGDLLRRFRD